MGVAEAVSKSFESGVRSRGQTYFRRGRVSIQIQEPKRVIAVVSGSNDYEVQIERRKSRLAAWCTCPYCDGYGEFWDRRHPPADSDFTSKIMLWLQRFPA